MPVVSRSINPPPHHALTQHWTLNTRFGGDKSDSPKPLQAQNQTGTWELRFLLSFKFNGLLFLSDQRSLKGSQALVN